MKETGTESRGKASALGRAIKPIILIVIGILIAFPLFSIGYYTMVRNSTPGLTTSMTVLIKR